MTTILRGSSAAGWAQHTTLNTTAQCTGREGGHVGWRGAAVACMVLQRYRAKQELGKGSFGTVYLTEGRRDKKPYVVKVVDNLRGNNLKIQEIRVMMHLRHRNIVEMCDFYTSNNQLCIVMGYADGGDLRNEVIKARNSRTQIPEELICVWLTQVCQALDYAHEEQIIHRDIKPSNIFLMADCKTVKVGDFGISKVLDSAPGANQMTAAEADGGRVGTKRYMAPEILDRKDYSNKADIWSLGCVLFELLTLNHPTYEQDRQIWFEWIPDGYSRNIREICQQCLSENAMLRPSPKELIVKFAGPFLSAPVVQHEFFNAMQWYDAKLEETRSLLERQADLVRQLFPKYKVPVPTGFGRQGAEGLVTNGPGGGSTNPASSNERGIAHSDPILADPAQFSKLYGSQAGGGGAPPEQSMKLPRPLSGVHQENMTPLRASMSSIEHFNIPEYTENHPTGQWHGGQGRPSHQQLVDRSEVLPAAQESVGAMHASGASSGHHQTRSHADTGSVGLEQSHPGGSVGLQQPAQKLMAASNPSQTAALPSIYASGPYQSHPSQSHDMYSSQERMHSSVMYASQQQQQEQPSMPPQQVNLLGSQGGHHTLVAPAAPQEQPSKYASLRGSFDTRSPSDEVSLSSAQQQTASFRAPGTTPVGTTNLSLGKGDTTGVLEELERVRHGIQATLAATTDKPQQSAAANASSLLSASVPSAYLGVSDQVSQATSTQQQHLQQQEPFRGQAVAEQFADVSAQSKFSFAEL